jgi:2-polyprenyl-6-methoxyphenol hydroxylase-like FAD-dependent oxidoreductase
MSLPSGPGGMDPVTATLKPAAAAAIDWHAIVIGAGPAGTAVAIRLARQGQRVLLVDRSSMPRPKVCGCCLSQLAVAELASLCPANALPTPLPLATVCLVSAGRSARMPMPGGGVLSREALDTALVRQAIAAGADWLPSMLVEAIHEAPSREQSADLGQAGVTVVARTTTTEPQAPVQLHGRVAVIAAGLADTIRIPSPDTSTSIDGRLARHAGHDRRVRHVAPGSRIGVGTTINAASPGHGAAALELPVGKLVMAVGRHGYCGLVRLEDDRLDLAAAVDRKLIAAEGGPAAGIAHLLHEACGDSPLATAVERAILSVPGATFRATPPLTHHSQRIAGATQRIFRVGDAASYVEPFTGEGIGWALAGGRILAESLLGDIATAAASYRLAHTRLFAAHHARCRWVARGVRQPGIVLGAVGLAQCMPWAARRAVPLLVGASISARSARC